jgi:hypothetical protein
METTITNKGPEKTNTQLSQAIIATINQVKDKIRTQNGELTTEELTTGIANSRHLLFNFLLDNNMASIVSTMKVDLRENIDFEPKRETVEAVLAGYIAKEEYGKLQRILDNFKFNKTANNYTTNKEVLKLLKNKF